jgi:hypothetical protein
MRIGPKTTLLAERRFYDDTYLVDDTTGEAVLFICDGVVIRGPSGRVMVRSNRDAITFPSVDALVEAVTEGGWKEAPMDGEPQWKPTREQIVGKQVVFPWR